ncbi:MAG: DAK2 domain-containing protein [Sporichthyaceae bacterium]|nr:DAK2 domain-containing protein [Sporichthyaceae bacterium]
MNGTELRQLVDQALGVLEASRDELRDLDAAVGDGDLGITVSKGCAAVRTKLAALDADPTPGQVLRTSGASFAGGNPSTMAALVGGALLAGAKTVGDSGELDRQGAAAMLRAAFDSIMTRGKAQLGDKTILDAMAPTVDIAESSDIPDEDMLARMVADARTAVEETSALQSRRGRAAWVGERSIGHPDPGATAYLRLLEALFASARGTNT